MNMAPGRTSRLLLAVVPFVLLAFVYVIGSAERRTVPRRQAAATGE
jgi:NitT/TauT family transport system permease protein